MIGSLLLTSFATWKPEQVSNSSDDLLAAIAADCHSSTYHYLRQIPVDFDLAPQRVIHYIRHYHPRSVICCGMGESRTTLDIESTAVHNDIRLHPRVNLAWLAHGLKATQISDDAGQFVCNRLYFSVLNYLNHHYPELPCVFVHVPRLTLHNQASIVHDFQVILNRMEQIAVLPQCSLAQV